MPFENDVSPSVHDEPMLCTGEIMYYGMPLFLVVATSHHAARHAAAKAKASFDALPAILTIDDALAVDSRFEDGPRIYEKGALEDGFAAASHRINGSFEMGGQEHFYLEGQAALAMPQENGDMVCIPRPSTRQKFSTRSPMRSACRCMRCVSKCAGWAAGLAARKAKATRWPWPVPWPRGIRARPAKCGMTATTI